MQEVLDACPDNTVCYATENSCRFVAAAAGVKFLGRGFLWTGNPCLG